MSNEHYDYLVFILRGQPFHLGHKSVIDIAFKRANNVILFLGSANRPRSPRNPWTFEERREMIEAAYRVGKPCPLYIEPLNDHLYVDNNWVKEVQATVQRLVELSDIPNPKIGLIGHAKDNSSYYLKKFPQWGESVEVGGYKEHHLCNATDIRELYFMPEHWDIANQPGLTYDRWKDDCPDTTIDFLDSFKLTKEYEHLRDEQEYCEQYKKDHQYPGKPYKPIQVTVDAVVVQSGHILLIERRAHPGKGLIALPGGYLDSEETLEQSMIRELREETKLKVAARTLRGSITKREVFDDPHRSSRLRNVTHAFLVELEPQASLPKVRGGDDAIRAFWKPLHELDPREMFEDHYFIIQSLIGIK